MSTYQSINDEFVKATPNVVVVNSVDDINFVIEQGFRFKKILLHQSNFNPDFFDLSTGLAGAFLQKIVNYGIKTAFLINPAKIKSEYFKELVTETQMMDEYRFFTAEEDAVNWLTKN